MKSSKFILSTLIAAAAMTSTAWAETTVAKIGDVGYSTVEGALSAVESGETITIQSVEGSEVSTELDFSKTGTFTITGNAPEYKLPIITVVNDNTEGNKTILNIEEANLAMAELDARQNATINVVNSTINGVNKDDIVKSYYNGAINISGASTVDTMQVTTMGYITLSDSANLQATWQTNVYGNGLVTINEGATLSTAGLNLTGQAYSGRDNTDAERVGKAAEIVVNGGKLATLSYDHAYYYEADDAIIGTAETAGTLTITNGGIAELNQINGVVIGAKGTINVNGGTLSVKNKDGIGVVANSGTINVSGNSTLDIDTLTGNAVYVKGNTTLTNSTVGGAIYSGFGANVTDSQTLTIAGDSFFAKSLYVGDKYLTGKYVNNEVHGLVIGTAEKGVNNVTIGSLYVRTSADATVTNSNLDIGDLFVRGEMTVTNSTLDYVYGNGGTGHWAIYEDDNSDYTASLTLDKSTVSAKYLVVGSDSNSETPANSNASLTLTNGANLTLTNTLYVQGADGFNVNVKVEDSTLNAQKVYNAGSISVSGTSTLDIATVTGNRIQVADGTTLKASSVGGSLTLLGDLTVDGGLTLTGGTWASNGGTVTGDTISALYVMFQTGTYVIDADMELDYGYLSYGGTFTVSSKIHTVGNSGEVLYIRGDVDLVAGGVLDADNGLYLDHANAVLNVKAGAKVEASSLKFTKSGAQLNVQGGEVEAGTVTNNGTFSVSGNSTITVHGAVMTSGDGAKLTLAGTDADNKVTATFDGGSVTVKDGASAEFKYANVTLGDGWTIHVGSDTTAGHLVVDNSTITGTVDSAGSVSAIVLNSEDSSVTLKNDSDYKGNVWNYGGTLAINGSTLDAAIDGEQSGVYNYGTITVTGESMLNAFFYHETGSKLVFNDATVTGKVSGDQDEVHFRGTNVVNTFDMGSTTVYAGDTTSSGDSNLTLNASIAMGSLVIDVQGKSSVNVNEGKDLTIYKGLTIGENGVINIKQNATLDLDFGADTLVSGKLNIGGTFDNTYIGEKLGRAGDSGAFTVNEGGKVNVVEGGTFIADSVTNAGVITVSGKSSFTVETLVNSGTLTVDASSTFTATTIQNTGTLTIEGQNELPADKVELSGGASVSVGTESSVTLTVAAGTIAAGTTVTVSEVAILEDVVDITVEIDGVAKNVEVLAAWSFVVDLKGAEYVTVEMDVGLSADDLRILHKEDGATKWTDVTKEIKALGEIKYKDGKVSFNAKDFSSYAVANVPEPSAFGLLAGLGALALVAARRRRRK